MRRGELLAVVGTALLVTLSCATAKRDGDRAFEAGDYGRAATFYRTPANLTQAEQTERVLYRLALSLALSQTSDGDPGDAIAAFETLLNRYPTTSYRPEAELFLQLFQSLAAAKIEFALASADVARAGARIGILEAEAKTLDAALDRARAAWNEADGKVRRLQVELEQLKRIDLQPPRKP